MKQIVLTFFMLFVPLMASSQTMAVSSFKALEYDLSAAFTTTGEIDQNGKLAALIRVVTTKTGFSFDVGALGIVKVKQTPGEVLVFIPKGAKQITIKHPQLGVLRDYKFPVKIESGRTYEMVLATKEVNQGSQTMAVSSQQPSSNDMKRRMMIMNIISDFESAYNNKNIAFFDAIYNENALLLTEVKVKHKSDSTKLSSRKSTWKNYRQQLLRTFDNNDKIIVNYRNLKITKHSNIYYGVTVEQHYKSNHYNSKGKVFYLFNFSNESKPSIDIHTWQFIDTPADQLYSMKSFESLLLVDTINNNENNIYSQVQQPTPTQEQQPLPNKETTQRSDVDKDIPETTQQQDNTFAIIIANENYGQGVSKVDYARNDGEVFKEYCHKTLGLPEKNVHFVPDATYAQIFGELNWLEDLCGKFKGKASVIFYYAGHGIPDKDKSSYLLPVDGNTQILKRTCVSLNELYETLGNLPAQKVTVLMDACFSGAKRDGDMLKSGRLGVIKAKEGAVKGNTIVLSAAKGDEIANKYDDAKHGLFTYFLLKKLKESKGSVTMGELSQYIQDQVGRYSIVEVGKSQTPNVQASDALKGTWESLHLE